MKPLADRIADAAIDHYDSLSSRGKPKENEWTVYAALVAVVNNEDADGDRCWVVSAATGTKCTAQRCQGHILHDCHAEVLVRRALARVLIEQVTYAQQHACGYFETTTRLLDAIPNGDIPFRMRDSVTLHLYISDSPCGDASIYDIGQPEVQFTGAKLIVSLATGVDRSACGDQVASASLSNVMLAREDQQLLGKLRSKSGRSNLSQQQRSTSMSCSDKLVLWSILGWQSSFLTRLVEPIRITSVVVSRDARLDSGLDQQRALQRAIAGRVQDALDSVRRAASNDIQAKEVNIASVVDTISIPLVCVVNRIFPRGKSAMALSSRKRKLGGDAVPRVSACGFAINWYVGNTTEVLVGARGICHGRKPVSSGDYRQLQSRLSRGSMVAALEQSSTSTNTASHYQEWKRERTSIDHRVLKQIVLESGPMRGWVRGVDDFDVHLR